ncbi:MAG: hypothetical protein HY013_03795 [Candidatus Solibacter usitatus]|nr:hypothetical protein [Candidatus Solibacter usitatus]
MSKLVLLLSLACAAGAEPFPYRATVVAIEDLTPAIKRVRFRLEDGLRFKPGQYVFLKLPDDYVVQWNERFGTSHQEVFRPYSFASSASRLPWFDLMIEHAPAPPGEDLPPGVASTYVHQSLREGDVLRFSAPAGGALSFKKDTRRPIVAIAERAGAAPFVSLLEYWFENQWERNQPIYLFLSDPLLDARFREWERTRKTFHYYPVSGPVRDLSAVPRDAEAYVAGSPAMIREVARMLKVRGIPEERIHYDGAAAPSGAARLTASSVASMSAALWAKEIEHCLAASGKK